MKILAKSLYETSDLNNKQLLFNGLAIEEYLEHCPADVVDKYLSYELLEVDFGFYAGEASYDNPHGSGRHTHPYLKMQNPSIDEIHIEPVGRNVKTVKEALKFRAPPWAAKRFFKGWFAPKVLT